MHKTRALQKSKPLVQLIETKASPIFDYRTKYKELETDEDLPLQNETQERNIPQNKDI